MDRREIEYVIVIAQEKTLSKAADRLFVSQPALSRFLLKIEDELGLPLFERRKRQLIPTYAGELYLATARSILQLQQKLEKELDALKEVDHGKLSVGITPGRGHTILPMILPDFRKQFPDYELRIFEEDVDTLERMLSDGTIEIAFFTMSEKSRFTQKRFCCELISQEEIVLCAPKNGHYELLSKDEPGRKYPWIDLKYLENDCFLTLKKKMRLGQLASEILESHAISPRIAELSTIDTVLSLVAQEYGVAFASSFRIEKHETADKISFFSFGEHPEVWDFVAAYKQDYLVSQPARFLINLVGALY